MIIALPWSLGLTFQGIYIKKGGGYYSCVFVDQSSLTGYSVINQVFISWKAAEGCDMQVWKCFLKILLPSKYCEFRNKIYLHYAFSLSKDAQLVFYIPY
jgi:hypothetical protein